MTRVDRRVRWTVDLCRCVATEEDSTQLFERFDDEPAARMVYYTLISLGLNPEYEIILYRQDRSGIGWSKAKEVVRSDGKEPADESG